MSIYVYLCAPFIKSNKKLTIMKKHILIILMLGLFAVSVFSQDIITMKTGEDISAKVTEITQTEIKYQKWENLEGPQYTVSKYDVLLIRYSNGTKDIFNEEAPHQIKTNTTPYINPNQLYDQKPGAYTYMFGRPIHPVGSRKSAWGSGIASLFFPGLGEFINGDIGGGLFFFGSSIAFNYVMLNAEDESTFLIGLFGGLCVNVCSIINASSTARKINIVRGYKLANNTYIKVQPKIIQPSNPFSTNDYAYGMSLHVSF
ncbi:MAG TPA: hypothetical protein DD409_02510 [Bacteroidales bacterium]|nr:hypothetical protein [Bacteroidales bacterium]